MASVKRQFGLNEFASDGVTMKSAPKRRRTLVEQDFSAFAEGSIIKIKVKNFVTYSTTEFVLSPSLNMIIGPNGTGKSTLVCALCLGLAGSPQLLGRQKTIANFIKNGEESGVVEVTLKDRGDSSKTITISREIYLSNKSDWHINSKPSNESKVKALLASFNIQLDNLCQFLPQEKVADFAKLSPKELLLETERAIDLDLLRQHEELIEKDNKKVELTKQFEAKKEQKESLERKKDEYEEEAKKYEEFQQKELELRLHEKLIPYAQLQDLKHEKRKLKLERDEAEAELREYTSSTEPFLNAANIYDNELQDYTNLIHYDNVKISKFKQQADQYTKKIAELDIDRDLIRQKIKSYEERNRKKLQDLEKSKQFLKDAVDKRDHLEQIDESELQTAKKQADTCMNELSKLEERILQTNGELSNSKGSIARVDTRITRIESQFKSNDRLHILEKNANKPLIKNTSLAIKALRSELRNFKGKVFESPCLSVSTKEPQYASYLETLVDFTTTFALTCIDKATYDEISHVLLDTKRINPAFRRLGNKHLPPKLSNQELRRLGFEGYLKDFVNGPGPVVQMLSEEYYIHDVPVSKRPLTSDQINYLTRHKDSNGQPLFRKFFAGDTMYNLQISRYGSRQIMLKTSQIKKYSYFSSEGMDDERRHQLIQSLNEAKTEKIELEQRVEPARAELRDLNAEKANLNDELQKCTTYIREVSNIRNERQKLDQKIKSLEDNCQTLEADSQKDYTKEIITNQRKIKTKLLDKLKILTRLADLEVEYNTLSQSLAVLKVKRFEIENKKITVKKLTKNFEDTKRELQRNVDDAKRRLNEFSRSEQKQRIMEQISTYSDETKEQIKELVQRYTDNFTETHINDVIHSLNASLKLLGNSSKSSIQNFEKLKLELQSLEKEIGEYSGILQDLNSSITRIHRDWEPRLEELVTKISIKFSSIFPTVGIAGDIRIAKDERYQEWKLQILVKFREESEFNVLDSHTQSGGERAVSTVYYMISMQELTNSPFRAVDEINQGMDERNERIVHKHMVETACLEHTSQYFLITPKLLTGLYYAENMRIHCIMAGPWTPNTINNPEYLSLGETSNYIY